MRSNHDNNYVPYNNGEKMEDTATDIIFNNQSVEAYGNKISFKRNILFGNEKRGSIETTMGITRDVFINGEKIKQTRVSRIGNEIFVSLAYSYNNTEINLDGKKICKPCEIVFNSDFSVGRTLRNGSVFDDKTGEKSSLFPVEHQDIYVNNFPVYDKNGNIIDLNQQLTYGGISAARKTFELMLENAKYEQRNRKKKIEDLKKEEKNLKGNKKEEIKKKIKEMEEFNREEELKISLFEEIDNSCEITENDNIYKIYDMEITFTKNYACVLVDRKVSTIEKLLLDKKKRLLFFKKDEELNEYIFYGYIDVDRNSSYKLTALKDKDKVILSSRDYFPGYGELENSEEIFMIDIKNRGIETKIKFKGKDKCKSILPRIKNFANYETISYDKFQKATKVFFDKNICKKKKEDLKKKDVDIKDLEKDLERLDKKYNVKYNKKGFFSFFKKENEEDKKKNNEEKMKKYRKEEENLFQSVEGIDKINFEEKLEEEDLKKEDINRKDLEELKNLKKKDKIKYNKKGFLPLFKENKEEDLKEEEKEENKNNKKKYNNKETSSNKSESDEEIIWDIDEESNKEEESENKIIDKSKKKKTRKGFFKAYEEIANETTNIDEKWWLKNKKKNNKKKDLEEEDEKEEEEYKKEDEKKEKNIEKSVKSNLEEGNNKKKGNGL